MYTAFPWDGTGAVDESRVVLHRHPGRPLTAVLAPPLPGTGSAAAQNMDNAGPGKCRMSGQQDAYLVAKNQQIFVVELYNYLEQVT